MKTVKRAFILVCCIVLGIKDANSQTTVGNIGNGISFVITGCTGDSINMRVALSFKFSNPSKPDQRISIAEPTVPGHEIVALDENSKSYSCTKIDVGGYVIQTIPANMKFVARIRNGLSLTGSFTFSNIMPSTSKLALVTIFEKSSNWEGGGGDDNGVIQVKNVPIVWSNTGN